RAGIAAAVGEAHQRANRLTLQVSCPAQTCRLRRGRKGRLAPGPLGMSGSMAWVHPVYGVDRIDDAGIQVRLHGAHGIDPLTSGGISALDARSLSRPADRPPVLSCSRR